MGTCFAHFAGQPSRKSVEQQVKQDPEREEHNPCDWIDPEECQHAYDHD
jgi:hypothetical protein